MSFLGYAAWELHAVWSLSKCQCNQNLKHFLLLLSFLLSSLSSEGFHTVNLRTGNISILRQQAKLGTHRTLQQAGIVNDDDVQQDIPRAAAQLSPWWGPLSTQQIYILSFGPGHIPCQQDQYQSGPSSHQQNEEQHLHQYVPSPSLQAEVTGKLHHMGGSLLSYLHPSAWMILVTPSIVEQLQSFQGVCLAPLMPEHKLAPEWTQLMADLLPGSSYKRTGSHTQGEADTETMVSFDGDMSSLTGDSDVGKGSEDDDGLPSSLDNASDMPADTGSVEGHQTMQGVKVMGGVRGSAWRMQNWGSGLKSGSSLHEDAMHGSMLGQQEDVRQEEDTERLQEEAAKQQGTVDSPGAAAPSSVYIHVHFPHLDTLDMSRLGLTHPHQHWTKSACNSKLAVTREEEDGKDDEMRMLQKVTSPLRVRQCLTWLERNGTYCPVAAALQDWSLALKKEWSSQRELRDHAEGDAREQGSTGHAKGVAREQSSTDHAEGGAREQGSTDHAEAGGAREQRSTDPCQVHMMHEHGALLLLACPEDLTWLLPWLSVQPSVKWISPAPAVRLHNLVAGAIVQTGNLTTTQSAYNAGMHPFWQTGIDGSGQVIGCGDSGVDVYNCYFYDPNVPFTIVNNSTTGTQEFTSSTHRKLVLYLGLEDMVDGNGHGSHVAGTLLGSPVGVNVFTQPTLATGLAPNAKLAFIDLGKGSSDLIITYTDLTSYYPYAYGYGARVHSDSWGSSSSTYDSLAMSVDQYTWQYTDFLPIFAAGNYGADVTQSSTISSPAVSKNCIAVGAGLTLQAGYQPTVFAAPVINAVLNLSTASGDPILTQSFAVVQASFGPQALSQLKGLSLLVVAAEPQDACEGLSKQVSMPGLSVLVVVQRGGCSFTQKSQAVQAAGATAAIITNDVDDGYFVLLPAVGVDVSSGFNIPVMGVPLSTGRWLWAAVQNKGTISFSSYTASTNSYDSVASYSSFGPTPDGRIKPDLIAPGDTVSATTSGTLTGSLDGCGTTEMQGTSMATPVVAASAVMIRQYFMDGFYPSGVQTPGNKVNVSGVLVKAILMGGAISMPGSETLINPSTGQYQSLPLEAAPSSRQGWGRVDLTRSLPLPNSPLDWNLQVVDLAVLTQGQTHEYCVYATGGPLRITLAWFDYPADLNAPAVLVNNLNLQVTSSAMGGFVLLGNNQVDTLNTVEMVSLESMPRGSVNITVIASSIFYKASPQPYALVVLGMFSGVLVSGSNPMKGAATASLNAFNGNANNAAGGTTCTATVALIQGTYPNVTSSAQVTFTFSSSTGSSSTSSTSPTNFQCMLSNTSVLSSQQLSTAGSSASSSANHVQQPLVLSVWTACTSPMSYTGLADGSYVFQVRPVGQPVTDSRMFTVDATPPKLSLSSTLSTSTLSPVLSLNSTSQDSIVLTFTVIDITSVTLSCAISVTNFGSVPPPYFRTSSMLINASGAATSSGSVSWTGPCKSPLTLYGLYFGTWEVVVTGVDAADNVASTPPISWIEAFTSGVIYTRVAASPTPLTNKPNLSFALYSFRGAGSSSPTLLDTSTLSYQYQLLLISNTSTPLTLPPTLSSLLPSSSWTAISMQSVINITVPSDGQYVFGARALAADGSIATAPDAEATTAVQVLTVPPVLVVVSGPPAVQSQTVVTIIFQTTSLSTDQVTYSCRWLFGYNTFPSADTLDVGGKAFTSCNGPSANSSTSGVDTGYWLFQVKAEDKAGNISPPLNVTFLTDTQAPIILASAPTATRLSRLGITSTIRSTIAGLTATVPHVANSTATSSCILTAKWTSGAPAISSNITSISSSSGIKSLNSSIVGGSDSSSPSLLDVVDGIAYSNTSALASSMAKATQGRVGNSLSPCPSPVLFDVQEGLYIFSLNATSAAGMSSDSTHIIVVDATSPVSQITTQFTSRPYPSQVSLRFISHDLPITYNSGINTSLCAINYTGASTKNEILAGGYNQLYNSWGPCVSPLVLSSLQTGLYTLQVKAVDNAGNMGLPASPLIFSVDDSLPLNSSATIVYSGASDASGLSVLVIGIVAGVGSLLIAAIIIGVMVIRRSFRHLLDDGSDPVLLWSPPAAWLQQFSEDHNDGASGVIDTARGSRNHQRGRINGFSNLRSGGNGRDRALISIPGLGTLTTASMDEVILEEWERERTRQTIQASIEQEQLKTALQRSLVEFRQPSS